MAPTAYSSELPIQVTESSLNANSWSHASATWSSCRA